MTNTTASSSRRPSATQGAPATAAPAAAAPTSRDMNALRGKGFADQEAALAPGGGGGGDPLPPAVRLKMERALGGDFADVRIHVGPEAVQAGAQAFTRGRDIFFAPGLYDPESTRGQELLGHELAHVVQQGAGKVGGAAGGVNADAGLEGAADQSGARAARGDAPATSAPGVKPAATSALPIQRKGGNASAVARSLAAVGSGIDVAIYNALKQLVEIHDEATVRDAVASVGNRAFTTVARGDALIAHLAQGLMPLLAAQAAEVCLDDTLAQVLGLSLALQNAGVGVIMVLPSLRQDLAASGRGHTAITNAFVAVPTLMTSGPQAIALVDHIAAGGSAQDAQRGVTYAGGDAGLLAEALTALRTLVGITGADVLAADLLAAVLDERTHLTSDTLRTNAVALAATASARDDATQKLGDTRAWGYRPDFKQKGEDEGDKAQKALEQKRTKEISDKAESDKKDVIGSKNAEAFEGLTRREQITMSGKDRKLSDMKPRPKSNTGSELDTVYAKFDEKRVEKAKDETDEIDRKKGEALDKVTTEEGPAEKSRVETEHKQFFAKVGHHKDALLALRLANDDFDVAESIIQAIVQTPALRPVFADVVLDSAELQRALGATAIVATMLGNGVTPTNLKSYLGSDDRTSLLGLLGTVSGARVNALAACFGALATPIGKGQGRADLATLCGLYNPADIVTLYQTVPGHGLDTIVTVHGCAANVAALTQALAKCDELGWKAGRVVTCLGGLVGLTATVLYGHIYAAHLAAHNKNTSISGFVNAVNKLIGEGYLQVTCTSSGWDNLNGAGETYELCYDVQRVSDSVTVEDFVVHFHPGVSKKTTNSKESQSRYHIKADRHQKGEGNRVRKDATPTPMRGQITWEF